MVSISFCLQRFALLQILPKQIIVDINGGIVEHELNSPFA